MPPTPEIGSTLLPQLRSLRDREAAAGRNGKHHAEAEVPDGRPKAASDARYPFSLGYQKKLLALLISHRTILPSYGTLIRAGHFGTALYRDTAGVILDLWTSYGVVPTFETVEERVEREIERRRSRLTREAAEDWRTLLAELRGVQVLDAKIVLGQLTEWIQEQALKVALREVGGIMDQAERTGERDFGKIRGIVSDALAVGVDSFTNTLKYFDDAHGRVARLSIGDSELGLKIPLVMSGVDRILDGGPSRKELVVWASPTGRGKTHCILWVTKTALFQGKKVALVTTEMSAAALARRLDRSVAQMLTREIRRNPELALKRIANLQRFRGDLFIIECMGKHATVEYIRSMLERYRAQFGFEPDVIAVDYPGNMTSARQRTERRFEQAEIYRDLRALAFEWDATAHAPMQTNRSSLTKNIVTIKDLAECFEVAWHADLILALCQTPEEELEQLCRIFIAKYREGQDHFVVPFHFNKDLGTFTSAGEASRATNPDLTAALRRAQEEGQAALGSPA